MRNSLFLMLGVVAVAGCSADGVLVPDAGSSSMGGRGASAQLAVVQEQSARLARGFAVSMNEPQLRAHVRDALRASLLTEHKLPLRDFFATAEGNEVRLAMANAMGLTVAALDQVLAAVPALDLYMPRVEDRMTWRATENVAVFGVAPDVGSRTAYRTDGSAMRVESPGHERGTAFLALALPESKGPRVGPQAAVRGEVIQEANDGQISGRIVFSMTGRATRTVELASIAVSRREQRADGRGTIEVISVRSPARWRQACQRVREWPCTMSSARPIPRRRWSHPTAAVPAAGPRRRRRRPDATASALVQLHDLIVQGACDGGSQVCENPWNDNEMRFTSMIHDYTGGPEVERTVVYLDGVQPFSHTVLQGVMLTSRKLTGSGYLEMDVWEEDPDWMSSDDEFDPNPFIYASDVTTSLQQLRWSASRGQRVPVAIFGGDLQLPVALRAPGDLAPGELPGEEVGTCKTTQRSAGQVAGAPLSPAPVTPWSRSTAP